MSGLIPLRPGAGTEIPEVPESRLGGVLTEAEQRSRWEVRAAQWRALELAREAFGPGVRGTLIGIRPSGGTRGLLRLRVPFLSLESHRARERAFLDLVGEDPVMERVPLLFVLGADEG